MKHPYKPTAADALRADINLAIATGDPEMLQRVIDANAPILEAWGQIAYYKQYIEEMSAAIREKQRRKAEKRKRQHSD